MGGMGEGKDSEGERKRGFAIRKGSREIPWENTPDAERGRSILKMQVSQGFWLVGSQIGLED